MDISSEVQYPPPYFVVVHPNASEQKSKKYHERCGRKPIMNNWDKEIEFEMKMYGCDGVDTGERGCWRR
jgi:hypothetical protein